MLIVSRLTSRSSVALSVSIGYARIGGGRGTALRSRSPDDDECSLGAGLIPLRAYPFKNLIGFSVWLFRFFQAVFSRIFLGRFPRHTSYALGPQARYAGLAGCFAAMKENSHESTIVSFVMRSQRPSSPVASLNE